VEGRAVRVVAAERVRAAGFFAAASPGGAAAPAGGAEPPGLLPWRAGAMRIWISDLLFPGEPVTVLRAMSAGGGCALVFVPVLASEAGLAERGNLELVDREGGAGRKQRIDDALAERYRAAYARHFALWEEAAKRAAAGFARIGCGAGTLAAALAGEARTRGVVEALA